jgi:hypothetical protein
MLIDGCLSQLLIVGLAVRGDAFVLRALRRVRQARQ